MTFIETRGSPGLSVGLERRTFIGSGAAAIVAGIAGKAGAQLITDPATSIYAVRNDGDLLFYQHAGIAAGTADWPIQARKIRNGWEFRQVFASRA
jgi:hypothetical protein